jgi:hypothetical protein
VLHRSAAGVIFTLRSFFRFTSSTTSLPGRSIDNPPEIAAVANRRRCGETTGRQS